MIYSNLNLKTAFREYLHQKIQRASNLPRLIIVQIGDSLASQKYASIKQKLGTELGLKVIYRQYLLDGSVLENGKLVETLKIENLDALRQKLAGWLRENSERNGLIFQLPVPTEFEDLVSTAFSQNNFLDVDFLGQNSHLLWQKNLLPPTIQAIDLVLKDILLPKNNSDFTAKYFENKLDLSGKIVAVVGQGQMVGRPLLTYLQTRGAGIVSINKETSDPQKLTKLADILICAAGRPGLIDETWIKSGALVIDAATAESDGVLVGDVDAQKLTETGLLDEITLCPSPGGVGPLTVLSLFWNLLRLNEFETNNFEN